MSEDRGQRSEVRGPTSEHDLARLEFSILRSLSVCQKNSRFTFVYISLTVSLTKVYNPVLFLSDS
jgi:hypothetical protein